jgi:hypothetical protein
MWFRWLIPWCPVRQLPTKLAIAAAGALVASVYGVVHDQITYTISPEYFTDLKFEQFAWADFGWPRRVFVGQIGLLASWWVGLLGGWFFARAGAAKLPPAARWRLVARSFAGVVLLAMLFAVAGWVWGLAVISGPGLAHWQVYEEALGLSDLPRFVLVAYIHNGSYFGAAVGAIGAAAYVWRIARLPAVTVAVPSKPTAGYN